MLNAYLQAALRHAHYEILPDDGSYFGEIPVCRGVNATAPTLEECREQLAEVLEEWLFMRIHRHLSIPRIDGHSLSIKKAA